MLDIVLFIALAVLSVRAFLALHREAAVLSEFGRSRLLTFFTLLYPLGPVVLFAGRFFVPYLLSFAIATSLFVVALILTSRQTEALERAGTDRARGALDATSLAGTGAIVGIIYVGLAAVFAAIVYLL